MVEGMKEFIFLLFIITRIKYSLIDSFITNKMYLAEGRGTNSKEEYINS